MTFEGKHDFGEINGTRVTFVEKGVSEDRMKFLKALLEHNGFNVLVEKKTLPKEDGKTTYTIGVDDIVFNPVIWVYERRLKTFDGRIVSAAYWEQKTDDTRPQYWELMFEKNNN
jgi:hypothetical protein